MRTLIVIYCILALVGCTSFSSSAPKGYKSDEYFYIEPVWIEQHRAELVTALVQSIRIKHPNTADWFPRVSIASIDVETQTSQWRNAPELQRQLDLLLSEALAQIYGNGKGEAAFLLALKIREASTEINPALYALMLPYGVACLGTLSLVCPVSAEQIVVTEADVIKQGKTVKTLTGAGAAQAVAISPYAGDSSDWGNEAKTKALVASLAQLADQFIAQIEGETATGHSVRENPQ